MSIKLTLNPLRRLMGKTEVYTFSGGIHPKDMKAMTEKERIIDLEAPKSLTFPLQQHIGKPAIPLVKVGDRVLMGQKIAEADGFVSANVHSSVSGTVTAIEPKLHPSGTKVESIVVENDGLYEEASEMKKYTFDSVSPAEIVDAVKNAGIVGMGGAAFPTHVKLSPPQDKKIKYIIINGAECEP